jgi:hypothetical protein
MIASRNNHPNLSPEPVIPILEAANHHLDTIATIIGSLGVILALRKKLYAIKSKIVEVLGRPKRLEQALDKIHLALFNHGERGLVHQVARISAGQSVLFQNAPYPSFECDSRGRNAKVNDAYLQLVGCHSEEELTGGRWHQVIYGSLLEEYKSEFARCSAAHEDFVGCVDFRNPATDEHRGRWKIRAPCATVSEDCLFVGRFIGAMDEKAEMITRDHDWRIDIIGSNVMRKSQEEMDLHSLQDLLLEKQSELKVNTSKKPNQTTSHD